MASIAACCSWRFLRSNTLEQLQLKFEKKTVIKKSAGKVRKCSDLFFEYVWTHV